jgi:hypothetical protein
MNVLILSSVNRIGVIWILALRVTPIFTSKMHAINTKKMAPLLRSDVMQSLQMCLAT